MMRIALLLLVVTGSGCMFFNGDDDDDCKAYASGAGGAIQAYELRDPTTGVCSAYGGGGGYDCVDSCGPCDYGTIAEVVPDYGQCNTQCDVLDEGTCKTTAGCRAAYAGSAFYQCWSVAMSGPIEGGTCAGLDAYTCSQHDDCVAIHAAGSPIGSFMSCAAEGTVSDPGSCVGAITCGTAEPACPMGTVAGRRNGCWTGFCIPYAQCDQLPACGTLDESGCIGRDDCQPIYQGQNCTCNGPSCTCQSWTFDSCEMM